MKVIGTAGHIDHGKSALVHALTGINPDRLSEEKRRGMTIDLGFAWLTLPSGMSASVVDVPGHERFIKNMLAGAGGIDVALLVVAADEGVMPQTREHAAILDLLGIQRAVVALTKSDLVDDEWLRLVRSEVDDLLNGTSLAGAAQIATSVRSRQGLVDLQRALDAAIIATQDAPAARVPYLPIDRVFTVAGFGTVVTGTLHGGELRVGDVVELVLSGRRVRLRSLQTHGQTMERVEGGTRVAANVAGVGRDEIERGEVLALPGTVSPVRAFDAHLRLLPHAGLLDAPLEGALYVGAAERPCAVVPLGGAIEPGKSGWASIRLDVPVAALPGQPFVIRLPSPLNTIAGGEIVEVEPRPRRRQDRMQRLERLRSGSLQERVEVLLESTAPLALETLVPATGFSVSAVEPALAYLERAGRAVRLAGRFTARERWERTRAEVVRLVEAFHESYPLRRGIPGEELRQRMHVPVELWPAAIQRLADEGVITVHGPALALPGRAGGSALRQDEADRLMDRLQKVPFSPPSIAELLAQGGSAELLAALLSEGHMVRLSESVVMARGAYDDLVRRTLNVIDRDGEVTVASLRDEVNTSRRYALAFLDHLDAQNITRRMGDARVRGPQSLKCG